MQNINNTQYFRVEKEPELQVKDVLAIVYRALSEKGYNPLNQIVGYICQVILLISPVIIMQEA